MSKAMVVKALVNPMAGAMGKELPASPTTSFGGWTMPSPNGCERTTCLGWWSACGFPAKASTW